MASALKGLATFSAGAQKEEEKKAHAKRVFQRQQQTEAPTGNHTNSHQVFQLLLLMNDEAVNVLSTLPAALLPLATLASVSRGFHQKRQGADRATVSWGDWTTTCSRSRRRLLHKLLNFNFRIMCRNDWGGEIGKGGESRVASSCIVHAHHGGSVIDLGSRRSHLSAASVMAVSQTAQHFGHKLWLGRGQHYYAI